MSKLGYFGAAFAGAIMFASAGNAVTVDLGATLIDETGGTPNMLPTVGGLGAGLTAEAGDEALSGLAAWNIITPSTSQIFLKTTINPDGPPPGVEANGIIKYELGISSTADFSGVIASLLYTTDTIAMVPGGVYTGVSLFQILLIPAITDFYVVARWEGWTLAGNNIDIQISAVPLPAALPLFGTGLGILGFLGWRRRRKQTAQVAA